MRATFEIPAERDEVYRLHDEGLGRGLDVKLGDRRIGEVLAIRVGPEGRSLLVDVEISSFLAPLEVSYERPRT